MTSKRKHSEEKERIIPCIKPFWNDHSLKISKHLYKCEPKLKLEQHIIENDWFTTLIQTEIEKIDHKIDVSKKEMKEEKETKTGKISSNRCKKVRVYPNKEQRETLIKWYGTARWTYNTLLEAYNKKQVELNMKSMRAYCINSDCHLITEDTDKYKWILDTPYEVRDGAMLDLIQALKTNFAKHRKDKKFKFQLKFRSKKCRSQTINILNKSYKSRGIFYPTYFGKTPIKSSEILANKLDYDSKLTRNYLGQYYLCLPQAPHQLKPVEDRKKIISIDPGVRTFATTYDPGGSIAKWGHQDIGRIQRLCHHADQLQSSITKTNGKSAKKTSAKRWHKRQAFRRIYERIRNLVRDFHCKFAKWLCSNYETILLPTFNSQNMVKKAARKLATKSARQMLTWSHYQFQQRLIHKSSMYEKCQVLIVDEAYTSKTCGGCGWLNDKLGASKYYQCQQCEYECDRDVNGARNILLKYLTEDIKRLSIYEGL
jgi:putative transposase